jgi:hypothetical protein
MTHLGGDAEGDGVAHFGLLRVRLRRVLVRQGRVELPRHVCEGEQVDVRGGGLRQAAELVEACRHTVHHAHREPGLYRRRRSASRGDGFHEGHRLRLSLEKHRQRAAHLLGQLNRVGVALVELPVPLPGTYVVAQVVHEAGRLEQVLGGVR